MAQIETVLVWRDVLLGLLVDSFYLSVSTCSNFHELVNHFEFDSNSDDLPGDFLVVCNKVRHQA